MKPVDYKRMKDIEATAREIGSILGAVCERTPGGKCGFLLMLFGFGEDSEFTYLSNANRADNIKMIKEFLARMEDGSAEGTWDTRKEKAEAERERRSQQETEGSAPKT
jgi:hypothetical protein